MIWHGLEVIFKGKVLGTCVGVEVRLYFGGLGGEVGWDGPSRQLYNLAELEHKP